MTLTRDNSFHTGETRHTDGSGPLVSASSPSVLRERRDRLHALVSRADSQARLTVAVLLELVTAVHIGVQSP